LGTPARLAAGPAWDEESRIDFYQNEGGAPAVVWGVGLNDGVVERVAEVGPSASAGVLGLSHFAMTPSGDAWAHSFGRRLSDLYVFTGIQ
jgi:hypothetical protein